MMLCPACLIIKWLFGWLVRGDKTGLWNWLRGRDRELVNMTKINEYAISYHPFMRAPSEHNVERMVSRLFIRQKMQFRNSI